MKPTTSYLQKYWGWGLSAGQEKRFEQKGEPRSSSGERKGCRVAIGSMEAGRTKGEMCSARLGSQIKLAVCLTPNHEQN